jgi:hypothetical protein
MSLLPKSVIPRYNISTMFCPNCKSEYRFGFTKCSDCGVDLVEHLSGSSADSSDSGFGADPDAMEILWAGADASVRDEICSQLDTANIPYEDDSVESKLMPAFPISIFRIQISKRDHEGATRALQNVTTTSNATGRSPRFVLDRNSALLNALGFNRNLAGRLSSSSSDSDLADESTDTFGADATDSAQDPAPDDVLEDFDPRDATAQVWSGDDREMAQYFKTCLREVGINCTIADNNGKRSVMVQPADDQRAKEIVREIIDQSPPA